MVRNMLNMSRYSWGTLEKILGKFSGIGSEELFSGNSQFPVSPIGVNEVPLYYALP